MKTDGGEVVVRAVAHKMLGSGVWVDLFPERLSEDGRHLGGLAYSEHAALKDLVISAWTDDAGTLTGWSLKHNGGRCDISELEAALKAMKKVERALAKDLEREGHPLSFGQFSLRALRALGVTHFVTDRQAASDCWEKSHVRDLDWKLKYLVNRVQAF